jgi:hypothetical protein
MHATCSLAVLSSFAHLLGGHDGFSKKGGRAIASAPSIVNTNSDYLVCFEGGVQSATM